MDSCQTPFSRTWFERLIDIPPNRWKVMECESDFALKTPSVLRSFTVAWYRRLISYIAFTSKMGLVLSITFCIYRVACLELAHLSLGDWKNIFITHLIIIIKSEISTFPIVVIFFPWLCVWDGCTIIFCHLLHIFSGNTGTLFPLLMFSLWYLQRIGYIMACRSCSFVCRLHHLIIIIMQTYLKALTY